MSNTQLVGLSCIVAFALIWLVKRSVPQIVESFVWLSVGTGLIALGVAIKPLVGLFSATDILLLKTVAGGAISTVWIGYGLMIVGAIGILAGAARKLQLIIAKLI